MPAALQLAGRMMRQRRFGGIDTENEIKTEDIIKSLRICDRGTADCTGCIFSEEFGYFCSDKLKMLAADRLELLNTFDKTQSAKLLGKINALETENELLRGALASCGVPENAGAEHFPDAAKMMLDGESIMQQAIETYGVQAQCDVAVEEMAELTKAIMKLRRVADDYGKTQAALENLLEEIADVDIMIDQLKIMRGPKRVEEYRRKKLKRLEKRLEGKHE